MKRFGILVLVVVLSVSLFAGCGANSGKTIENDDMTLNYAEKPGDSVSLPKGYPEKDFPLYKGAYISVAAKDEAAGFIVMAYTKDSVKKVADFYEGVLKDAEIMSKQNDGATYFSIGSLNKYMYTVAVNEGSDIEGYTATINISIMPQVAAD